MKEIDLVLVSAANWHVPAQLSPKFNHRYYGPYKVLRNFNGVTYQLQLPSSAHIHDTFHVTLMRRFHSSDKWMHTGAIFGDL